MISKPVKGIFDKQYFKINENFFRKNTLIINKKFLSYEEINLAKKSFERLQIC